MKNDSESGLCWGWYKPALDLRSTSVCTYFRLVWLLSKAVFLVVSFWRRWWVFVVFFLKRPNFNHWFIYIKLWNMATDTSACEMHLKAKDRILQLQPFSHLKVWTSSLWTQEQSADFFLLIAHPTCSFQRYRIWLNLPDCDPAWCYQLLPGITYR